MARRLRRLSSSKNVEKFSPPPVREAVVREEADVVPQMEVQWGEPRQQGMSRRMSEMMDGGMSPLARSNTLKEETEGPQRGGQT